MKGKHLNLNIWMYMHRIYFIIIIIIIFGKKIMWNNLAYIEIENGSNRKVKV